MWHTPKDVNYYNRLALINKVRKIVLKNMDFENPIQFPIPIPYSYDGGKVAILWIERHKYMSSFKREFTNIRVRLEGGEFVSLQKLRPKHLIEIYKVLTDKFGYLK